MPHFHQISTEVAGMELNVNIVAQHNMWCASSIKMCAIIIR
jgi:hypothetical protein